MHWVIAISLVFAYVVIGGFYNNVITKLELESLLGDPPAIIYVLFWPFFLVLDIFLLFVGGAGMLGDYLADWVFKLFKNPKKEDK